MSHFYDPSSEAGIDGNGSENTSVPPSDGDGANQRSRAPSRPPSPPHITEEEVRGIQETFEGLRETLNTIEDPDEETRTAISKLHSYVSREGT
jgi:hypothetical protein